MKIQNHNYLAFGGGVNSTALYILLEKLAIKFEAIFIDTGGERKETLKHIDYLKSKDWKITILKAQKEGLTLYEYIEKYKILPTKSWRWCTSEFKVKPMLKYIKRPANIYIGIDAGEAHRVRKAENFWVTNKYPLVEKGIDREKCREIIRQEGIVIPRKSGCWFCVFQNAKDWLHLYTTDIERFQWCVDIEYYNAERQRKEGYRPSYIMKKPLDRWILETAKHPDGRRSSPGCICEI